MFFFLRKAIYHKPIGRAAAVDGLMRKCELSSGNDEIDHRLYILCVGGGRMWPFCGANKK